MDIPLDYRHFNEDAFKICKNLNKIIPCFEDVEELAKIRFTTRNSIDSSCFLPASSYRDLFRTKYSKYFQSPQECMLWGYCFASMYPFLYTRQIYEMDSNLFQELTKTTFESEIPISILNNFPNFSVYIKLSAPTRFKADGGEVCIIGIWVSLGQNETFVEKRMEKAAFFTLHALQKSDSEEYPYPALDPVAVPIKEGMTLEQLVYREKLLPNSKYRVTGTDEYNRMQDDIDRMKRNLNVLLFLCSTNIDIVDKSPSVKRHPFKILWKAQKKNKFQLLPAIKSKVFSIGESFSAALKEQEDHLTKASTNPIRPHVRRAHWHGYWTGPRDSERDFILKWIPPTLVGTHNGYVDTVMMG